MAKKINADHELVKAKIIAGLSPADALECAQRQIDHDEVVAQAEEEAAEAAEKKAKAEKPKGGKNADDETPAEGDKK